MLQQEEEDDEEEGGNGSCEFRFSMLIGFRKDLEAKGGSFNLC